MPNDNVGTVNSQHARCGNCLPVCVLQVGEDPLNRREVAELHAEMRSPVFAAEVASRARSPLLMRPRDKTDHVTDILTLERPGEVVPQVRRTVLVPEWACRSWQSHGSAV